MTDVDTYWRTRCVGEAIDQGYTFLRLACGACQKWGRAEPEIPIHSQSQAPGYFKPYTNKEG